MADPAISLSKVNKNFGLRTVLKEVSFDVQSGDIFGYLGPNGAGKTTTIRTVLGLLRPNSGRVSILGEDVSVDRTRKRIGFVLEFDGLYENLNAQENLAYYSQIYGVSQPTAKIENMLDIVRLQDRARDKIGTYSKGMRQRLALARAMLHNPDVLILDEPTAGVDPSGQVEVRQIILDLVSKGGKTVFLSSHNLDEVQRICNRIALINRGEIRLYGELDEMQRRMGHGEIMIETAQPLPDALIMDLVGETGVAVVSRNEHEMVLTLGNNGAKVPDVVSLLARRGAKIEQVKRREASLEEIYTAIVKEAESR